MRPRRPSCAAWSTEAANGPELRVRPGSYDHAVTPPLLAALGLGLVASFFAAAETALFALNRDRLEALGPPARDAIALRARPGRLLAVTWVGRLGAGTGALAVLGIGAVRRGLAAVDLALVLGVALLALVLLEVAGRGLGLRYAPQATRLAGPILRLLSRALLPILLPVEWWVAAWLGRGAERVPRVTDREIRELLESATRAREGVADLTVEEHERRLIERVFALDRTRAWDAMTPRVEILAWPADRTLAEIAPELRTVPYSRIPLYQESLDDITGILYTRDAHQALISGQRDVPLQQLAREPFFVPGSVPLNRLLVDFQTRRIHMGIVIDEYGGTDGLITLEDVLEELVGEIVDERDVAKERIVRVGRSEILVDGAASLREINHFLNTSFPELEHRSFNGYLLEELGRVPEPGTKLERAGVLIEILEASETQVLRARVTRVGAKTEVEPPAPPSPPPPPPDKVPRPAKEGTPILP